MPVLGVEVVALVPTLVVAVLPAMALVLRVEVVTLVLTLVAAVVPVVLGVVLGVVVEVAAGAETLVFPKVPTGVADGGRKLEGAVKRVWLAPPKGAAGRVTVTDGGGETVVAAK